MSGAGLTSAEWLAVAADPGERKLDLMRGLLVVVFLLVCAVAGVYPERLSAQTISVPTRSLVGRVVDETQMRSIPEVQISIAALSRTTFTDSTGAFRLDSLPSDRQIVVARKIGYEPTTIAIAFGDSSALEHTIILKPVAILDAVAVRETPWLSEFEENRRLGLGKFLTPEDVEKLNGNSIASRISEFPNVALIRPRGNTAFLLARRGRTGGDTMWCKTPGDDITEALPCGCYARVYVDGMVMNPPVMRRDRGNVFRVTPPFDVNTLPTMSISAVEWYAGPAQMPSRYNRPGSECGVLVIHTKRGK